MNLPNRIAALRVADPKRFQREVRAALRKADGDLTAAAEALGVTRRGLSKWIACEERKGLENKMRERCGACAGCQIVKGLRLRQPGRPEQPEEEEE